MIRLRTHVSIILKLQKAYFVLATNKKSVYEKKIFKQKESFNFIEKKGTHFDAFAFMNGKWRGKGWYLKNDVKEPFEMTQWVKNEKNEVLSIYGFSQKTGYKEKLVNFSKTILWDSVIQKQTIQFIFKDEVR